MQLGTDLIAREALQLLLALGLGATVGLERRLRGHPAGIHTDALVSLGLAAFVVAGLSLGGDVPRVAAHCTGQNRRPEHDDFQGSLEKLRIFERYA